MRHLITMDQHMHARGMTSLFATEFMDFTGRTNDPLRTFRMSIIFLRISTSSGLCQPHWQHDSQHLSRIGKDKLNFLSTEAAIMSREKVLTKMRSCLEARFVRAWGLFRPRHCTDVLMQECGAGSASS